MKIAIPLANDVLCPHFGQCQQFAVIEVNPDTKEIISTEKHTPPPHEPGAYPEWLSGLGCNMIIAGGMGGRAISLFEQNGIHVIIGIPNNDPVKIVNEYLNSDLKNGKNLCGEPGFESRKTCED